MTKNVLTRKCRKVSKKAVNLKVTCYFLKGKLRRMAEAERDGFDLLDLYIVEKDIQNNTLLLKKQIRKSREVCCI